MKYTNWEEMNNWAILEELIVGMGIGCILAVFFSILLGHVLIYIYSGFWTILLSDTVAGWIL
jgi:Mg/Co/Ni transporter MgtE